MKSRRLSRIQNDHDMKFKNKLPFLQNLGISASVSEWQYCTAVFVVSRIRSNRRTEFLGVCVVDYSQW